MHVTVIAKTPTPGRVKTRLCPPCTPHQAAEVAAAALADTFDGIDRVHAAHRGLRRVVLLDGDPGEWVRPGYDVVAQRGDGLGERLANGFAELGPGVIVGMDTPVATRWLGLAVRAVRDGVDVIGLALDGGYWAIGLTTIDPRVFADVPMSTPSTGITQLRRLHAMGRPARLLPAARDLDDVEDLRLAARHDGGRLGTVARRVVDAIQPGVVDAIQPGVVDAIDDR
jgi:uncharacterized protein